MDESDTEEKELKRWARAQETLSFGVEIRGVSIKDDTVEIEGWLKSSQDENEEYGVLLPLKKGSKDKYNISMNEANHHCKDVKYRGAIICKHIRALAIYVENHFKEIKRKYNLKGVNLA